MLSVVPPRSLSILRPASSIALALLLSSPAFSGAEEGPAAAAFSKAVGAWRARDAAAVVAEMPKDARLSLVLDGAGGGRINVQPTRENAQAILKGYFERIDAVTLKDVTPARSREKTRTYDYGYRTRSGEAKATRLSFTLVLVEGGSWALSGVEERPRPR